MLSVILPSYNEEKMIPTAAERLASILEGAGIDYELLFVDDGSKDSTWKMIERSAENNSHIVGIHFSRNFGKESAMFAGLEKARGDCCAVIDCDLQHPRKAGGDVPALGAGLRGGRGHQGRQRPGERLPPLCRQQLLRPYQQGHRHGHVLLLRL
ncbi:MAG: glycosyltransferase [Oscillospiraceae bacterium]